jgi:hypothetical protein
MIGTRPGRPTCTVRTRFLHGHGLEPDPSSRIPDEGLRLFRLPDGPPPAAGAAPSTTDPAAPAAAPQPLLAMERTALFVNREQSWLSFNRRVLEQALDETVPLLERVKFLAIASTNLDEFFEVRVAGTMELVDANLQGENPDGIKAAEELELVRNLAHKFNDDLHRV